MSGTRGVFSIPLVAAALATVCLAGWSGARAQCVTGDVEHTIEFKVQVTGELDRFVIWNKAPEMFMRVYVDGFLIDTIDGQNGNAFEGQTTFDIADPYDPVEIELELMDEDPPLDDYTVDIVPGASKTLKFSYDPLCQLISEVNPGDIWDCPAGNKDPACGGLRKTTGSEAWMQYKVGPSDGIPVIPNSLSIADMEVIQVVPNASVVVAERPTVVRMKIGNSHPTEQLAQVKVTVTDKADKVYVDELDVSVPGCSVVDDVLFFGPEWDSPTSDEAGFRPLDGEGNVFQIEAEIDPAPDCVSPPCQADDCRVIDGKELENELELRQARQLRVQYQPFARSRSFPCHDDFEPSLPPIAHAAAEPILRDLFPINDYFGRTGTVRVWWPLPGGDPISDLVDVIDPRPGLLYLELSAAVLGIDRLVLLAHDSDTGDDRGLQCHWPSMDLGNIGGASAGNLSRVILAEPEDLGVPNGNRIAHEIGHTFGLSEAACPIDERAFGGIACEDEYNFPTSGTVTPGNGVPSFGIRVRDWTDPAEDRVMDGTSCVMGASGPSARWIDNLDYEELLQHLTSTATPGPALQLLVQLRPGWGGSFVPGAAAKLDSAIPNRRFDAATGRNPDAYTTTLRMLRSDDSLIGTFSFTAENLDLDEDGWVDAFGDPHSAADPTMTASLAAYDMALTVPLPADAARIQLVRRSPGAGDPPAVIEAVEDTLELSSLDVTVELLAPRSSFMATVGETYDIRWRTLPGVPLAALGSDGPGGTESSSVQARSFVFLSPDDGVTWFPLAAMLSGTSVQFTAEETQRYQVRVFATTGFETDDVQGEPDLDHDGCGISSDPDGQFTHPDGSDQDGVAQVCDLCPSHYDPLQADTDDDIFGDACDNCVDVYNPQQANQDQDALGDLCDCSPADPDVWRAPGLVTGLQLAKSVQGTDYTDLAWDSQDVESGPGTVYDAVVGDVGTLGTPNAFLDAVCVAVDVQGPSTTVYRPAPAPGKAQWFLLRGDSPCGDGSYDSGGPGQVGGRDDSLDQAPSPCA